MEITKLNVTVMVSDMDRAIAFYTKILGLKLVQRFGNHWADIQAPGIAIGLHPSDPKRNISDNLQIGIAVKDTAEAVKTLEERGVVFEHSSEDDVQTFPFKDPDGNSLYLIKPWGA